ncbi:hypothetical protein RY27_05615 [Litorilinea aerophila]|nr:hypothetical protein RY27_05615 [Litorilinea aerophila]
MKRPYVGPILPPPAVKPRYVSRIFARIANSYDQMSRRMSAGQDQRWRRKLVELCDLPPRGRLLDVGTGTGDIAYTALARMPGIQAVGTDFTYEMMAVGQAKAHGRSLPFVQADTLALPFPDNTFDAVVSGFLLRNVVDRVGALREQARVTRPGGRVVCLETTPPSHTILGPLFQFYFFKVVPVIGGLVSGDRDAYAYLPHSTLEFPEPSVLAHLMEKAGLRHVFYEELMFGTVAIHVGTK